MDREPIMESGLCYAVYDLFPINVGHILVIPKRHIADYFELNPDETRELWEMVGKVKTLIEKKFNPQGFNIGINVGKAAGQTIDHVHIHIIPRYEGDVEDPTGGVRNVIPERGNYLHYNLNTILPMQNRREEILAGHLDELIEKGGSWAHLEKEGNKHAIRMGFKTRCTPSLYRAHIKYRQIKDPNYLGKMIVTDEGIFSKY